MLKAVGEGKNMGWVKDALKELAAGREVQVRPFGGSMRGASRADNSSP
jgi:hypothetical protein